MTRVLFSSVALCSLALFGGCVGAESPEVGAASEPLSERTQNILRCDANPILATLSSHAEREQFRRGCRLFFEESFDGNGRTCGSCHLQELGDHDASNNHFDFTPEHAQAIFADDPSHPLFRPIDSDDGAGEDYTTLLSHALVRIPFVLPPNVTVDEVDSPLVDVDPVTGRTTVHVLRSTPTVENMLFETDLMWDGRFGSDLERQAREAVTTHFEPARLPTDDEAADIAFFQQQQFSNFPIRRWANGGPAPTLPDVPAWRTGPQWDSIRRGRNFFVTMPVTPDAPVRGGHCATCHSGPMLDTTNEFNPINPPGMHFTNNLVSETNVPNPTLPPGRVGIGLPELTYHFALQYDLVAPPGAPLPVPPGTVLFPAGTVFTLRSPDPGILLTNGDPCTNPLFCILSSDPATGRFTTSSVFRISSLWGAADSAPYFHDNSAESIEDVLPVYRTLFQFTALGTGNPAWILSPQEEQDIANYVRFAFRRDPVLLP